MKSQHLEITSWQTLHNFSVGYQESIIHVGKYLDSIIFKTKWRQWLNKIASIFKIKKKIEEYLCCIFYLYSKPEWSFFRAE